MVFRSKIPVTLKPIKTQSVMFMSSKPRSIIKQDDRSRGSTIIKSVKLERKGSILKKEISPVKHQRKYTQSITSHLDDDDKMDLSHSDSLRGDDIFFNLSQVEECFKISSVMNMQLSWITKCVV